MSGGEKEETNEFSKRVATETRYQFCNNYKIQTMLLQQPKDQDGNVGKNIGPWDEKEL